MPHEPSSLPSFADVPVAILAGGLATRLHPITRQVPKALVEVSGRPFIDHQLDLLRRNGMRRIVLCVGHLGEQIAAHVGDGAARGLKILYSFDGNKLLGTGGALRRALPLLGEACWVLYGDSYLDIDYQAVFDAFQKSQKLGLMTVLRNGNQWDTSNVVFRNGGLLCYDKRNRIAEMEYIDYGASLFRRAALERIPENQCFDLADLMRSLVRNQGMAGYEVHKRFYEIGSHAGLLETARYLRRDTAAVASGRGGPP
jgi:NDP-sugar pyrophosphorylase family protein